MKNNIYIYSKWDILMNKLQNILSNITINDYYFYQCLSFICFYYAAYVLNNKL